MDADLRRELKERGIEVPLLEIGRRFAVTVEEAFSKSRAKPLPAARHAMWAWLKERRGWTVSQIARLWKVADHSTVRFGIAGVRAVPRGVKEK